MAIMYRARVLENFKSNLNELKYEGILEGGEDG